MDNKLVGRVLDAYGVKYCQILAMQKGYRNRSYPVMTNNRQLLNLILYKREAGILNRIKRADAVSNYLHGRGLPARHSADKRIITLHVPGSDEVVRYAALYEYLPGDTIPWEAYTMDHIKLLGKTLSDMHMLLQGFKATMPMPDVRDESQALLEHMSGYFATGGVRNALAEKLALQVDPGYFAGAIKVLHASRQLHGSQMLHMDFVRSNILFKPDIKPPAISGILDFEKTAIGPPVFDVARSLAFLLVDCKYKPYDKVWKYFVRSGYLKRSAATLGQGQQILLQPLVRFFLLHDFYKFLRHNPYEYLPQNEHFVRTRDILLKDGIIKSIVKVDVTS